MFWTAVASSTLSSNSAESSAGLASAAPSYQQQHTKPSPLRASSSSWQLSNAAFKSRLQQQQLLQQHQQQIQQQQHEHQQQQQQQQQQQHQQQQQQPGDLSQQEVQANKEPKHSACQKHKLQTANIKKKISPRSESKIFKAFTSCKCTQK
ncbi:putative uncharacterized protein DDB_G0291608 [Drosophila suzukii]|uniref:Uncharacterized protein n=1 Tax=Drosophila suzukii TaxID=28584 RepID=A0AB39ZC60_DROSZ